MACDACKRVLQCNEKTKKWNTLSLSKNNWKYIHSSKDTFAVLHGYGKPFVVLVFLWFSMIGQWYGHILSKEQLTPFMCNLVHNICKVLMNWNFNCISATQLKFTDVNRPFYSKHHQAIVNIRIKGSAVSD